MTIESVIASKLAAVGTFYPLSMPKHGATLPGGCYQFISETNLPNHSNAGTVRYRLQVSCWARSYAAAITLKDSVKAALSYNKDQVQLITPQNGGDFEDPEAGLYRKIIEFYVWQ